MKKHNVIRSLYIFAAVIAIAFAAVNFIFDTGSMNTPPAPSQVQSQPAQTVRSPEKKDDLGPFEVMLQSENEVPEVTWDQKVVNIVLRLLMAIVFSFLLVFRPRKHVPVAERSLHVAETQMLLALVAAALMMIVGDSTARAFAIFAAVSLVRFRTNIKDPKEVTVLVISLALGLAAGVGRWDLGLMLSLTTITLLWFLESVEATYDLRTMELTIKTTDEAATREAVETVLQRFSVEYEVLGLKGTGEPGKSCTISYGMQLKVSLTTDRLSDLFLRKCPDSIESITWKASKRSTDIFD